MSEQTVKEFYREKIHPQYGEPIGSSREEISKLEAKLGIEFPSTYIRFLEWIGNDIHGIFCGSNIFLEDIIRNTDFLEEFLEENHVSWESKGKPIVFYCHQDYAVAWFDLPDLSNSGLLCYYYHENWDTGEPEMFEFWDFILDDLQILESSLHL